MVQFTTHNHEDMVIKGGLRGKIHVLYEDLVKVFGEPLLGSPDNKTDAHWDIEFLDEEEDMYVRVTIYNYKDGVAYMGEEEGLPPELINEWHVGGQLHCSVDWVFRALNEEGVTCR